MCQLLIDPGIVQDPIRAIVQGPVMVVPNMCHTLAAVCSGGYMDRPPAPPRARRVCQKYLGPKNRVFRFALPLPARRYSHGSNPHSLRHHLKNLPSNQPVFIGGVSCPSKCPNRSRGICRTLFSAPAILGLNVRSRVTKLSWLQVQARQEFFIAPRRHRSAMSGVLTPGYHGQAGPLCAREEVVGENIWEQKLPLTY